MNTFSNLLFLLVAIVIHAGCGSQTPFSRGQQSTGGDSLTAAKPIPSPSDDSSKAGQPAAPAGPDLPLDNCVAISNSVKKVCETEFVRYILPALTQSCDRCHDNPGPDFKTAISMIEPGFPEKSKLYLAPTGHVISTGKKHKAAWPADGQEAKNLEEWITGK